MLFQPNRTLIICEMSQTYEGSYEVARRLVQAAIAANADAIKFQVFAADELSTTDYKHYDLFKRLEFTGEQWGNLIKQAHDGHILAFADVFGLASAQILLEQGIDGFKIHSTDIKNTPLLEYLAKTNKPLFLSTGGSYEEEIKKALSVLQSNNAAEVILMHGFQSYPTLVEHTNLYKIKALATTFNLPVGFADHIDGDHDLRYDLCTMAMGMGVRVLEKHITLERLLKMEDYESALNPTDFKKFVERVRQLDQAFGLETTTVSESETAYRQVTKKHLVAGRDLAEGTVITETVIVMKRTAETYEFLDRDAILGKTLTQALKPDQVIRLEFLK